MLASGTDSFLNSAEEQSTADIYLLTASTGMMKSVILSEAVY
jgi:hypothetical protein